MALPPVAAVAAPDLCGRSDLPFNARRWLRESSLSRIASAMVASPIHASLPTIRAQVVWAVRHEMARTVDDVLSRRTRDLVVDARGLSRQHAVIDTDASGRLQVTDLGSTNGTFVNRERISAARALAGDDDAIPVRVDFESGRHHAEILHTVLHPCAALGQEGDRQGAQMIFRGQGEGHAGRPAALVYVRGSPPLADDLAVIASDRDHIMLP